MRSIRYRLLGKLKNLDDCLDYAKNNTPTRVLMALVPEEKTTMFVFTHYNANFYWVFENKNVDFKKTYTTIFAHDSKEKQKAKIDKANEKLEADIEKIANAEINLTYPSKEFDYDAMY